MKFETKCMYGRSWSIPMDEPIEPSSPERVVVVIQDGKPRVAIIESPAAVVRIIECGDEGNSVAFKIADFVLAGEPPQIRNTLSKELIEGSVLADRLSRILSRLG